MQGYESFVWLTEKGHTVFTCVVGFWVNYWHAKTKYTWLNLFLDGFMFTTFSNLPSVSAEFASPSVRNCLTKKQRSNYPHHCNTVTHCTHIVGHRLPAMAGFSSSSLMERAEGASHRRRDTMPTWMSLASLSRAHLRMLTEGQRTGPGQWVCDTFIFKLDSIILWPPPLGFGPHMSFTGICRNCETFNTMDCDTDLLLLWEQAPPTICWLWL